MKNEKVGENLLKNDKMYFKKPKTLGKIKNTE